MGFMRLVRLVHYGSTLQKLTNSKRQIGTEIKYYFSTTNIQIQYKYLYLILSKYRILRHFKFCLSCIFNLRTVFSQ